jgi:hypothetical protein
MGFDIETTEEMLVACDCCGTSTRKLAGLVHNHDAHATVAAYFARWTDSHLREHGSARARRNVHDDPP